MLIAFYYFLLCITVPRVFYQWNDTPFTGRKQNLQVFSLELIALLPIITGVPDLLSLVLILSTYHLFMMRIEQNTRGLFLKRGIELLFVIAVSSFTFGTLMDRTAFNTLFLKLLHGISENNIMIGLIDGTDADILLLLLGIIFLINEWNNLIRYILGLIKTEPVLRDGNEVDTKEFGKGKIIGIVERSLFYFFVLTGNYASIGFILTAKGITRYRNLDNRDFAEYVLIGTLLSSSVSIFWAYLIQQII